MKNKITFLVLISAIILLIIMLFELKSNEIKQTKSQVEVEGEKILLLNKERENVQLPHLNIKGKISEINSEKIVINLSENSKKYLETNEIILKNKGYKLEKNNIVFLKFININIEKNNLYFSEIELYKLENNIKKTNEKNDYFTCKNPYGEELKITGKTFKYNNNIYFLADQKLDENNEVYFVNVENGNLLIEDYKSSRFPYKIYNMVNPQETMFEQILEIYL